MCISQQSGDTSLTKSVSFAFNQWAWGSNPHGRTKSTMSQGASCFFVVSTSKTGHKWGFEQRGPSPIRRAKNAVARHFLARGRGPPRAHQKEPCKPLLKSALQGSFSYAIFRFSVSSGLKLENRFTFCCCVRWTYPYYLSCTMDAYQNLISGDTSP